MPYFYSNMTEIVENSVTKMTEPVTISSEDISTMSLVPLLYIIKMPYSNSPASLFFEGGNVTNFLDCYSYVCDIYQISMQEKIRRLLWYCEMFTSKHMETITQFVRAD